MYRIYDSRQCLLGEGPLWHPLRQQLFWFDILNKRLLSAGHSWQFEEPVSACAWIDAQRLLIAGEQSLFEFFPDENRSARRWPLPEIDPALRCNDGRADPWGGFWIGTMGKQAEAGRGAIWRFYRGQLYKLFGDITIPNAICFAPDRRYAYFTDTPTQQVMRQPLDETGFPKGQTELFIDLRPEALNPDGAVVDAAGHLWNAQWGAARLAQYDEHGHFVAAYTLGAENTSCPAFGGEDLNRLFCTSALQDSTAEGADQGKTFVLDMPGLRGQAETAVITD